MKKLIIDTLKYLDASDKEIRFFLANYALGTATVSDITKESKLERSTAYLVAQKLIKKGLVVEDLKSYNKLLTPASPDDLLRMLAAKKRKIGKQEIIFKENLKVLKDKYSNPSVRPRVRVHEGVQGLLTVWKDIMQLPQEVLLWTNQETEGNLFTKSNHQLFIEDRIRHDVSMRVLAINNKLGRALPAKDADCLRQTKLLPEGIDFSAETYIYGDKVATLDFNGDIIGVIIESSEIAKSQRAIFETLWSMLR